LAVAHNNKAQLLLETDFLLDPQQQFLTIDSQELVRESEGVRPIELISESLDRGPHVEDPYASLAVLGEQARLDELAPCHDIIPGRLKSDQRGVPTTRALIAIDPAARGSVLQTKQIIYLRHAVQGALKQAGGVLRHCGSG